jgi:hypothetical protein
MPGQDGGDSQAMRFESILFATTSGDESGDALAAPECLTDLGLDQFIERLSRGREGYRLAALFHQPLACAGLIAYRQAVMQDIATAGVHEALDRFTRTMRQRQRELAQAAAMNDRLQAQRWQLEAAASYRRAVNELRAALDGVSLASAGLMAFRDYLNAYACSEDFLAFCQSLDRVTAALDAVHYTVLIEDDAVEVRAFAGEADYLAEIEAAFAGLGPASQSPAEPADRKDTLGLNVIEAGILDRVAALFPEAFDQLAAFCRDEATHLDPTLARFEREVGFYLAYRELMTRLEADGVAFCYPELVTDKGAIRAEGVGDIALAAGLAGSGEAIVTNDFAYEGRERVLVVTGPNQGGKTTFARSVGQLHYLAALGLPVPAREARLLHVDAVLTHFDREEAISEQQGRLEADLWRTRAILDRAGPHTLVILNELFQSTQAGDAAALTRRLLTRLVERDALTVCVTFAAEAAAGEPAWVTMVSTRDPDDPQQPAYGVVRRQPDGRAHAETLAARHGLTPRALARRLAP